MTPSHRRRRPRTEDTLKAAAIAAGAAAGVAAVTFYVTRILLAREPLSESGSARESREKRRGEAREG